MSSAQMELKKVARRYSAEEKKLHIEQWKLSKLSRSEYCRRAGLCLQTFSYWFDDKKAAAPIAKSDLSFVPLAPQEIAMNKNNMRLEIHCMNGLRCSVSVNDVVLLVNIIEGLSHVTHS